MQTFCIINFATIFQFLTFLRMTSTSKSYDVVQPIQDIIDVLFLKNHIRFDLITYGETSELLNEILEEILIKSDEKFAPNIQLIDIKSWHHVMNKSAVVLMLHPKYFVHFNSKVTLSSTFYNPLRFLIFCISMNRKDLKLVPVQTYLSTTKGHISLYEYILINQQNKYTLNTFEWFANGFCNKPLIIEINSFNRHLKSWDEKLKIKSKFRNFYGCMLTMSVYSYVIPDNSIYYPAIDLFKAMAKKTNFTANFQTVYFSKIFGGKPRLLIRDGFATEHIHAHFIVPRLPFVKVYTSKHLTTSFIEDVVSIGLSKPEAYSSFEKMILPFDILTWIFSITTFLIAFGTIFGINLMSEKTQEFFYGKNVKTPALNALGIFFGISQTQLPKKSFSRMILITFVMFCLVLRTAYQGVLFTLMATDMGKPLPQTIEDLYDMNYS